MLFTGCDSIGREIATLMGANVYLDTTYTGGARFVFEVPVKNE